MRLPSKADETDALPYPIETIRYWYVSPFGGRSSDLEDGQVGVNRGALERNTELEPRDPVAVAVVGKSPERPLFLVETFEVVPLDERKPEAAGLSPLGEIVLPDALYDFVRRPHLQPRPGEAVVMKATAAKLLAQPPAWLEEVLRGGGEPRQA